MVKIEVLDGPVYQWDTGRKVKVVGENVTEVHFSSVYSENAYVTEPTEGVVTIPSVILQSGTDILVYVVSANEDGEQTIARKTVYVNKRSKPDDYIYAEDEVFTFKQLEERIAYLEEHGSIGGDPGDSSGIDVRINGTSIVNEGVVDIPIANYDNVGLVKVHRTYGTQVDTDGTIVIRKADDYEIKNRSNGYAPITANIFDKVVKVAMTDGKGAEWTTEEKASARERMGLEWKLLGDVTVEEDGVTKIEIPIDNPNYNEYQFYVYVADRKTATAQNMNIGFNGITSTSYTLTYVGVGTNTNYFLRAHAWRNCDSGWLTLAMGSKDGKPYSQSHIRACDYLSNANNDSEKPTKISVSLSTGLDIGSRFIVYAR